MAAIVTLQESGPWAGWLRWNEPISDGFLAHVGPSYGRRNDDLAANKCAMVGLETIPSHSNRLGTLHGGFLAAFADHAYFAALAAVGMPEQARGVTIDLTMQYLNAGSIGPRLIAQVDLLRETGRLLFMRMLITQDNLPIAASSATIRKAPKPL